MRVIGTHAGPAGDRGTHPARQSGRRAGRGRPQPRCAQDGGDRAPPRPRQPWASALSRASGLQRGAMAGTVAHDHHNLVVIGADDESMRLAAQAVADMGGGLVVVAGGEVQAALPLPVAGLMSDRPIAEVRAALRRAARRGGGAGFTAARSLYGDELYGARGHPQAQADRPRAGGCGAVCAGRSICQLRRLDRTITPVQRQITNNIERKQENRNYV